MTTTTRDDTSAIPSEEKQANRAPLLARAGRVGLVIFVWSFAVLPVALGVKQCTIARVFHAPCPGCGLTRAANLMLDGHVGASLHMHPLVVPILAAHFMIALSTVYATWTMGTPFYFYEQRFGRVALWTIGIVYALTIALWIARWFGVLGGPVPV